MGQSADGTEVRLLKLDEELAEILSARLDEVRLIEADFAPQHLPILIGDANGIFRRLEPAADSEEISQQYEVPRAAKHGDELGAHLQVRWSDSREYALIVDLQPRELWIYESSADLLRRVRYDLKAFDPLVWDIEDSWAVSWDVYWLRGQAVAVVPRRGYDWTLGSLLIDVATGVAASLDPQSYGRWACLPTGTWRPAGAMFQVAFYWTHAGDAPGDNAETPYWTDGTAVRLRGV